MVRPILRAVLFGLAGERVERLGGYRKVTVSDLAREYREGTGDCGVCFEYAVHDAIKRGDRLIVDRVSEVLEEFCKIRGTTRSILFGAEKGKKLELLETDAELLTDESRILVGARGKPPKLKRHLEAVRKAFAAPEVRGDLPPSIRGLWRTDLFVGVIESQQWVATTLKINSNHLQGDAGIRVGIFPEADSEQAPSFDEARNLVLCPVPYDGGFVELFYTAFFIVKTFLDADARVPKPVLLPNSFDRQVARQLEDRRKHACLEVIEALESLAQPQFLTTASTGDDYSTSPTSAIAPIPRVTR
jgi:hypothetical protein